MLDRKYMTLDQVERLQKAWTDFHVEKPKCRAKHYWVWLTLLHTGARITEVLKLTDSSFLAGEKSIRIERLKLRNPKAKKFKTVAVSDSVYERITLVRTVATGYGQTTPAYRTFYTAFKYCCEKAGITDPEVSHPHAMRHSYAKYLLDSGLDSAYVAQILGHASITSTMTYLETTPMDLRKIMKDKNLLRA